MITHRIPASGPFLSKELIRPAESKALAPSHAARAGWPDPSLVIQDSKTELDYKLRAKS